MTTTFETSVFDNGEQNKFSRTPLPLSSSICICFSVGVVDVNGDDFLDIVLGVNLEKTRVCTGKYTGNNGFIFIGSSDGSYCYLNQKKFDLNVWVM